MKDSRTKQTLGGDRTGDLPHKEEGITTTTPKGVRQNVPINENYAESDISVIQRCLFYCTGSVPPIKCEKIWKLFEGIISRCG
jgi:hypothetical protein